MTLELTTVKNLKESLTIAESVLTHDKYLTNLIQRFSDLVERYLGRGDLTSASATEGYDALGQLYLILRRYPVTAISSITIDGTALAATDYKLLKNGRNGLVQRIGTAFTGEITRSYANVRWPDGGDPERIQITYTAGYATSPLDLEQAAIESCTLWYARRLFGAGYLSEALGSYSRSLDKPTVNVLGSPLPIEVIAILNAYKEIAI